MAHSEQECFSLHGHIAAGALETYRSQLPARNSYQAGHSCRGFSAQVFPQPLSKFVVGMKDHAALNMPISNHAVSQNWLYHMHCCYTWVTESAFLGRKQNHRLPGQLICILLPLPPTSLVLKSASASRRVWVPVRWFYSVCWSFWLEGEGSLIPSLCETKLLLHKSSPAPSAPRYTLFQRLWPHYTLVLPSKQHTPDLATREAALSVVCGRWPCLEARAAAAVPDPSGGCGSVCTAIAGGTKCLVRELSLPRPQTSL